jgi:hypothetical protein
VDLLRERGHQLGVRTGRVVLVLLGVELLQVGARLLERCVRPHIRVRNKHHVVFT